MKIGNPTAYTVLTLATEAKTEIEVPSSFLDLTKHEQNSPSVSAFVSVASVRRF